MTDTREPRVFRAGDTEPDDVLEVRHSNSQRFQRCDEVHFKAGVEVDRNHTWTAGDGDPLDWHELTSRLRGYTLTEVLLADREQGSELERDRLFWQGLLEDSGRNYADLTAERDELKALNGKLMIALDVARVPHQAAYVDPEHQGGNCIDVIMERSAEAHKLRAERDGLKVKLDEMADFAGQQSNARRDADSRVGRVEALCREWETEPASDWTAGDAAEGVRAALAKPAAPILPGDETPQPEEDQ